MSLNSDQEKALKFIKTWWYSDHQAMILNGSGGVGKSFLVDYVLKTIPNLHPIIIAPTNEALLQIVDKVTFPGCLFETIYRSLGLKPIEEGDELKFEEQKIPAYWQNINICIADEGSMYSENLITYLLSIGVKVLFVGHDKQLPPVKKNRRISDPCISPLFTFDFPTIQLTIPQRNGGELWEFTKTLERRISEENNKPLPTDFDISRKALSEYIAVSGKDDLFAGRTKLVLWTNHSVDEYNHRIRKSLFGEEAKTHKYVKGDKIILTNSYVSIPDLELHTDRSLKRIACRVNKNTEGYFYSNAKAEVVDCSQVMVKLNTDLHIPAYKLTVSCDGKTELFYDPVYKEDHTRIAKYYEHLAWNKKDKKKKDKCYLERAFIRRCFSECKHFYAATAHRLQGSSVENIILILADMEKNPNKIERAKCIYVGASRAMNKLMIYRGVT